MFKSRYIKSLFLLVVSVTLLTGSNFCFETVTAQPVTSITEVQTSQSGTVSPLQVVNSPTNFLNQTIKMNAKFDKFSTLGLDYKSALKSSDEYISFLIKRDDTVYDIPLSEMKLFLKREIAEKYIDLKTNDEVFIVGTVFSDALGDAWVEVSELTLVKKASGKSDGEK